jgi:uncharacterized protein (DUF433 family)
MNIPATPETPVQWKHLAPNPRSHYRQLFIKGTRIRAEVIYGCTVDGSDPASAEEVASGYGLPLEVVLEAIAYCESQPSEIEEDHRREEARMKATGMDLPGYSGRPRILSAQEIAKLDQR